MPYKSPAQNAFMHSQKPEIAKKWDKEIADDKAVSVGPKKPVKRRAPKPKPIL